MITLRRLDLVRQESPATAEELHSLQVQLNALPLFQAEPYLTVLNQATQATLLPTLSTEPSGFIEITVRGQHYVLPFFKKA